MAVLRVALLLACCTVCAFAVESNFENENTTMDPLQNVNESFSKLNTEECATALMCLWLEVAQLPRKRMIERIDTVFKQFVGLVNVSAERAMLEEDETFTNSLEARDVLRGMRSKLETAEELTKKLENSKTELLTELEKGDAVDYSDVVGAAFTNLNDLVKYMETISGIDGLNGRDRNVSASLAKLLPNGNLSSIINGTARDIVQLRDVKMQLRDVKTQLLKAKAIYVATVQRERETVRLSGCTDLWKQLLTFVGWR